MKHFTWFLVIISLLFCASASAGKIYQWTDAQGKRHFSSTPPASGATEIQGFQNDARITGQSEPSWLDKPIQPKTQQLTGHWKGFRLGKPVELVFAKNGNFIESIIYQRQGYTDRHERSYGGRWNLKYQHLSFSVTFRDKGSRLLPVMTTASVQFTAPGKITIHWGDRAFAAETFIWQSHRSRPALPHELR